MSGVSAIRGAVIHRHRDIPAIAAACDVGVAALEAFATNGADLSFRALDALARRLLGGEYNAEYDEVVITAERPAPADGR
jgi:hypothetical protein